jgi:sugar lactone lactonase YvrE
LGEGPLWAPDEAALYWLDIGRSQVHRFVPQTDERRSWSFSETVSCIARRRSGAFVAATRAGFAFLDLAAPTLEPVDDPEPDRPRNRFNDGKCDPAGRFWAGSMDDGESEPSGALYCLGSDLRAHRRDDGYVITNGPAFSPDGATLYHTDTLERTIHAFDLAADGTLSRKREFVRLTPDEGYPDGMTTDEEGGIWVAHYGGGRLTRFTPDGRRDRVVPLPVAFVTSCAFGGDDLATLYVTTARKDLAPEDEASQPLAGGLFAARPGVRGLVAAEFAG